MQQHRVQPREVLPPCAPVHPLDFIVWVGSATQAEADEGAAAGQQGRSQQDVDHGGGPEGKQVQRLVAVGLYIRCVLVVVGLVNGVDPHITGDKPAEEEGRHQRVPGGAQSIERVGGAVFGLLGARQAGEQRQHQAEDPRHDQVDGDVVLPRTVVQVH